MGALVAVIGNSGVGKTTLARRLSEAGGYKAYLETHSERPFQALCQQDLVRYALPNQLDYLLCRAEQESEIRNAAGVGVVDGGLELDFHLFTQLFHQRGMLDAAGYELCERFYTFSRQHLPPPDLLVALHAPLDELLRRKQARARELDLVTAADDLAQMEELLVAYLASVPAERLITVDAVQEDESYIGVVGELVDWINRV
ncbi:MAG: deoxynucleoside kinase [Anaerolineales bacterium]|nr:deoxynucleoside kinase [Anaerolineales bacterium]